MVQYSNVCRSQESLDVLQTLAPSTSALQVSLRDEQVRDPLYCVLVDCMSAVFNISSLPSLADAIVKAYDELLYEHYLDHKNSRLRALIPSLGKFFTPLPFAKAWEIYDQKYRLTRRKFVRPTFHEVRHIMNVAQVMGLSDKLQLITFDGDETLYPDRQCFRNEQTAKYLTLLLRRGIYVAVVTAAGYGYQSEKYEERLVGLLDYWRKNKEPVERMSRFFLFGGESNYLLTCNSDYHLEGVPEGVWRAHQSEYMKGFFREKTVMQNASQIQSLLDIAQDTFETAIQELHLRCQIIRKERAVGIVPGGNEGLKRFPIGSGQKGLRPELLEEVCLRVRHAIKAANFDLPYCAFNGGNDVWVDIGNKAEGIKTLQNFLGIPPHATCHVGDQFLLTGNDRAARHVCPTLWIVDPQETNAVLRSLMKQIGEEEECSPPLTPLRS